MVLRERIELSTSPLPRPLSVVCPFRLLRGFRRFTGFAAGTSRSEVCCRSSNDYQNDKRLPYFLVVQSDP